MKNAYFDPEFVAGLERLNSLGNTNTVDNL